MWSILCLSSLPLFITSTLRLFQQHGSRAALVWTEGRRGWWESELCLIFFNFFFLGGLIHSGASIFPFASGSSQVAERTSAMVGFQWETRWLCCTWKDGTLRLGMRVCHHGDRQSDRHIEESVAVLPSVPPPSPSPFSLPPLPSHRTETPTCCWQCCVFCGAQGWSACCVLAFPHWPHAALYNMNTAENITHVYRWFKEDYFVRPLKVYLTQIPLEGCSVTTLGA